MVTVTPSTCVTGRHIYYPNSAPCDIADRKMSGLHIRRWSNGRILACHAGTRVRFPDGADSIFALTPCKYV